MFNRLSKGRGGAGGQGGAGKASTVVFSQFLWYKYSYRGQFQATNFMALKVELGRDAPKGFSPGGTNQAQHAAG